MSLDRRRARATARRGGLALPLLIALAVPRVAVAAPGGAGSPAPEDGAHPAVRGEADDGGASVDLGALDGAGEPTTASEPEADVPDAGGGAAERPGAASEVRVAAICTNCNAASLSVNGLAGEHVELTFDGVPAAGGLGTVYSLTQYPAEMIGHGGGHRGPGSVLTGASAIAGTIELHSPTLDRQRQLLTLQVGSWAWRQLRYAMTDRWGPVGALVFVQGATENPVDANGDSFNEVAEFERLTAEGIFQFDLTERQHLTLRGSYYDENQVDGPGAPLDDAPADPLIFKPYYVDEDVIFNWKTLGIGWEREGRGGLRARFDGRYSKRNQAQHTVTTIPEDEQRDEDQVRTFDIADELSFARFQVEKAAGATGHLTAGVGWQLQRLRVQQRNDRLQPYFIVDALEQREAFAQYDRSTGARWDWSVGLRWDEVTVFGRTVEQGFGDPEPVHETDPRDGHSFVSPRAQAHYRAGSKWVLGVAAGRGIVGPRPSFAETCCGAKYQRNLGLPPERAWSYQLRAEWHPTPDQRLTVTGFWTDFTDYQEKVVYKVSAYIPYYSNRALDEARVRGVDLVHDLRFRGNRWNVGWSYTWTDADGTYTWDTPPPPWHQDAAGWRPWSVGGVRYVPEHAASAFVRYDHPTRGTKWSLSITHKGAVSHFLLSEGRDEWDQWELLRSESFTTVDASFEQRVGRRGWSVLGGVNNVTDYSMPDLGEPESSFDWGPITGRFFFAGAKFER